MMYSNLLALMGYSNESANSPLSATQSQSTLQNQIVSLQNIIAALADKIKLLETSVSVLQGEVQPSRKNTPDKILGTTLMLKDDLIRGKKYRRWYALYSDTHARRRWIYIGTNVQKAKEKILAWFSRHPQDASSDFSSVIPSLS